MSKDTNNDNGLFYLNKLLFASFLQPHEVEQIDQKSTVVSYSKRETIIKRGEFATHFLYLIEGFVKVELNEGSKTLILDIQSAQSMIGFPLFFGIEKHTFTITTLTDSVVMFIPVALLRELIESNGKAAMAAINFTNENYSFPLIEKLQCLSLNNIRGRLARLLLYLYKKTHGTISFNLLISRTEIAQMVGFSRENVIRMLSEFHTEGIVNIKGKSIEIVDVNRLEEMVKYG